MRAIGMTFLAMAMMASSAYAQPLAPGKPSGVQQARISSGGWVAVGLIGVVALGVGLSVAGNGNPPLGTIAVNTK